MEFVKVPGGTGFRESRLQRDLKPRPLDSKSGPLEHADASN